MNIRRITTLLAALAILLSSGTRPANAADKTWDGGGTDNNWSTAANWDAAIANGDSLFFDGSTRLTTTNNTTANNDHTLTFNSGAGAFTLWGNVIDLVSGGGVTNKSANAQTVNLGIRLLGNATFTSKGGTLTIGGAITENGNALKLLTVEDSGDVTFSGNITANADDLNITKTGSGTLTLSGDNGSYNANTVTVNAGTLILDYGIQNNTKLDGSTLVLGGGTLTLSGGSFTENLGSATLNAGASSITRSSGTATLQMNGLTRNVGSTIDFGANGIATTDNGNVNGILGGWGTVGGTTWAIDSAGGADSAINGLATYETSTTIANWGTTEDISIGANPSANLDTRTINSLRLTGASTVTINSGQRLTNTSGGILVTGSGATTITGGAIVAGGASAAASPDLIIHQNSSADMTIASVIANGNGTDGLTKSGTGRLILSGANTYSGQTYVNQGVLSISANNNLGAVATGAAVNLDGGTLQATATFALNNGGANHRAVTLADNGGTIDVTGANTLTLSGNVTGLGKLTKTGTGTLTLSGVNTYTGVTTVSDGTLSVGTIGNGGVAGNLGQASADAGNLVLGGGTLQYTGASASTDRAFTLTAGTTSTFDVSTAGTTLTLNGGAAATTGGLTKIGSGTLLLNAANAHTGTTTVNAGTLAVDGDQARDRLANAALVTINNGGTFEIRGVNALGAGAGTQAILTVNSGGTLSIVSGNSSYSVAASHSHLGNLTLAGGTVNLSYSGAGTAYFAESVQLDGSVTVTADSTIQFGSGANNANAGVALNGNNLFVVDPGVTLNVSAELENKDTGANGFSKNGTGTMIVSGLNTYSGATTINNGVLNIRNSSALGTTAGGTTVQSGAALQVQAGISVGAEALTLNGSGISSDGALRNLSGNNSWSGDLTLGAASTIASDSGTLTLSGTLANGGFQATISGAGDVTASGVISGTGGLAKTGTGTLTLTGTGNNFSGGTTLSQGQITLGANNALGSGGLEFAGGLLNANNRTVSMGVLSLTADSTLNLLDDGTTSSLTFSSTTWTDGILTITGWSGSRLSGSDDDAILITTAPNQNFLDHVRFQVGSELYYGEMNGNQLVPSLAPVPEPTEWALILFATLAVLYKFVWPRLRSSLARG